jgi:hypothetical protein
MVAERKDKDSCVSTRIEEGEAENKEQKWGTERATGFRGNDSSTSALVAGCVSRGSGCVVETRRCGERLASHCRVTARATEPLHRARRHAAWLYFHLHKKQETRICICLLKCSFGCSITADAANLAFRARDAPYGMRTDFRVTTCSGR